MASTIPRPRASLTPTQGLSPVMKAPLGSRVVLSRRRNGTVKYVGKLANESGEWYGVALDEPKGDNDGMRGKDRYFHCPANHGIFVRRKEINCVKEPSNVLKGPLSPVTDDNSSCSSNVSTDQQGELYGITATGVVHPAPTNTDNSTSPLMKTFKGFRKQLDFISLKTTGPGRSRESSPVTSPVSSTPSSPTAKSGLRPPSPFRRFASFSQGLPIPGGPASPTNKTAAASSENQRRQSGISLSPKPSPVRRINSFRVPSSQSDDNENSIRPVTNTLPSSPNRFSSFQYSSTNYFTVTEENADTSAMTEDQVHTLQPTLLDPESWSIVDTQENEVLPPTNTSESDQTQQSESVPIATPIIAQVLKSEIARVSSSQLDNVSPGENTASVETINAMPTNDPATQRDSLFRRTMPFHVPPIDISAIVDASVSPASSPRHLSNLDDDANREDSQTSPPDRSRSFRLERSSSFRIPSIDEHQAQDSGQGSPSSPSGNSPSSTSTLNDSQGLPTSILVPSFRVETSTASAAEPRVIAKSPLRSPRGRHELTAVESLSPDKKLVEAEAESRERPLFFRRMNVGRSPIERRSSCSSFSASSPSPPKLSISSNTASAAFRSSRVEELEREISAMRSSHENIVAVLRATNKQHAANVLELRAQVAALTEGNLLLERQLTAKGELVRELREMEKQQQRDTVSVTEVEKILEIKDTQIQTLEREMTQLRQRLARLEADKDSQLYKQFQHYETRRERDDKRINDLRKEVLAMCNERFELQSEVRDLKEMSLRFF
ncbi:hypothetical protein PI125_g3535 [Phytophthora idaei]|nr:hypothetical protein PI125_g3535 [Phytophthora idaei]KAG3168069.1 hypothetical protein PI126_g3492 [Phytophthora idaei]